MTVAEPHDLLHCTFCSKSQKELKKLIAGPGVYICDECIDLCNEIIDEEGIERSGTSAMTAVRSETLLAHLARITAESDTLIDHLRDRGVPWEDIAAALRRDDAPGE